MDDGKQMLVWGVYIFSGLYLAGVFVAALVEHNQLARDAAIVAAALAAWGYWAQLVDARDLFTKPIVFDSMIAAAAAGLCLL